MGAQQNYPRKEGILKMPIRRPRGIVARPDFHAGKKFPNGIKATIKSIRKSWPREVSERAPRTPEAFGALLLETYNGISARYGTDPSDPTKLARIIERLEGSGDSDDTDINFAKLRAYSDFIGIPTGLFLIYTQLVSLERHGKSRSELANRLSKIRSALEVLEQYVADPANEGLLFHQPLTENEYQALLAGLKNAVGAYKAGANSRPDK